MKAEKLKIELASQDKVKELDEFADRVIAALGFPGALVTDESMVWDFLPISFSRKSKNVTYDKRATNRMLRRSSKRLGFKIKPNDMIYELAQKLKDSE